MQAATRNHKALIEKMLMESFIDNQSAGDVIKPDNARVKRIQRLISYSSEGCFYFGGIYISDDETGCALVLFPDKKKMTPRSSLLDLELLFTSIGLSNLGKTTKREKAVAAAHPEGLLYHI